MLVISSSFVRVCSDSLGLKKIDTSSQTSMPDYQKNDTAPSRHYVHIIELRKMCANGHNKVCTLKHEHYSAMFQMNVVLTEF
jgi:hypothetical protein